MFDSALQHHQTHVDKISHQIAAAPGEISLQRTLSCCSRSFAYKAGKTPINISALNNILEINTKDRYIVVEPMVTMEQITKATLAHQLSIAVTPEFRQMTIGGAIQGLGCESSSSRFGMLDECVLEYELILGDGTVVTATKDGEYADLFHALTGSYGSIAVMTKIKLKLHEASRYVRIAYEKVTSIAEVNAAFRDSMLDSTTIDFIECIAVANNDFRIARGYKTNSISLKNYLFERCSLKHFWSPWYYDHLVDKSAKNGAEEYLSYEDYLFRWDRGAFWLGQILLQIIGHDKHTLFHRFVFGKMLQCENLYKVLNKLPLQGREQSFVLQDMMVPGNTVEPFFHFLDKLVGIYPLWLIPIKAPQTAKLFSIPHNTDSMYVDFGVWGYQRNPKSIEVNRKMDLFLKEHQGRKILWSQSYYTHDEFWEVYDKRHYQTLRTKYKTNGKLVNIHEKVTEYYRSVANEDHHKRHVNHSQNKPQSDFRSPDEVPPNFIRG